MHPTTAIRAHQEGLCSDAGDGYPGINTDGLLCRRGQRWSGGTTSRRPGRRCRWSSSPASRPEAAADVWARLTVAERRLRAHFLDADPERLAAAQAYAEAGGAVEPGRRRSARRQLELTGPAGDPAEPIDPLLERLS